MKTSSQEANKLFKKISRKAGETIHNHSLLAEGDHVLIGLSGGKDSMIMAEVLANRKRHLPFDFKISAAHVVIEEVGYKTNLEAMETFCSALEIPLTILSREILHQDGKEKGICFLCSWNRRKALFDHGKKLGCNKLAMGHHRYDALETMLINMIYHGSISSLPYSLSMFDGRLDLIRPLLDMDENLLADYAEQRQFGAEGITCMHEKENRREKIRQLLDQIEQLHGRGSYNLFKSMDKIFPDYLPQKKGDR